MSIVNKIILFASIIAFFGSCQKPIKLEMPQVEQSYVVEGRIETGMPPLVILTKTQGYFDDASAESIFGSFVHNADVNVIANGQTFPLIELCSASIPDSLLGLVSTVLGIPIEFLGGFNFCVYTSLDPLAIGQVGVQYDLDITVEGNQITSTTKIPYPVPLDTLWFKVEPNLDSLGFVWAILSDPDTLGNNYGGMLNEIIPINMEQN